MGDVADMIVEGVLCMTCGEYLDDDWDFPHNCSGCETEEEESDEEKER